MVGVSRPPASGEVGTGLGKRSGGAVSALGLFGEVDGLRNSLLGFALILSWAVAGTAFGQGNTDRFDLESKVTHSTYTVEVVVPPGTPPPGMKYPVAYCMDWFILGDYLKSLPELMELGRLTEPYIMVGITQGTDANDWAVMRTRDYTPAPPTDDYSKSNMYLQAIDLAGGAAKFTGFLKEELIPYIESKYPSDPSRRCFVGYSLGGLLGVDILRSDPQLFQYYLLGSASLWFNDYTVAAAVEAMPDDRLTKVERVYLSVGEDESWEMLKGFGMLRDALQAKGLKEPSLRAETIEASGHVGAMPIALYNGLRFLFRNE